MRNFYQVMGLFLGLTVALSLAFGEPENAIALGMIGIIFALAALSEPSKPPKV